MGDSEIKKSRSGCPTLHKWMIESNEEEEEEEEEKLELRLGLPGGGGEGWKAACKEKEKKHSVDHSMLSLGYSPMLTHSQGKANGSREAHAAAAGNALASNNSSQTSRSANTPVIGWPPVRTFRRNMASSSKSSLGLENGRSYNVAQSEDDKKALFVKINMDGIPIGRKIDLKAYDSYEKLSLAVDELFRGLLAAQKDPLAARTKDGAQQKEAITGLLDGTGEYTLVYEDYEGDRVLVGDVPWGMFVSSVKRLRVLKTADLSSSLITSSRKRTAAEC